MNPLAHKDPKVRLLNSGLVLGVLHIGLFFLGNENATPLRLLLSFTVMMTLLGVVNFGRALADRARGAAALRARKNDSNFPGAAP